MKLQSKNSSINILLVDDKAENLLSLEHLLEKEGRNFLKAMSGKDALKIALTQNVGLILLDVQMPEMDGFEVAQLLQSNVRTKDIAIIFVTAISKEEKYMMKGYAEGGVDYLYKPLDSQITKAKVSVFESLYHQRIELKNSYIEIEQINKQLDQFVHVVSHDLKAPLRAVTNLTEWMEQDVKAENYTDLNEKMQLIKSRVNRMHNLITGVLQYSKSRRHQGIKEMTDLNILMRQVIENLSPDKKVTIEIQKDLPVLFEEKIKLEQVFMNLIGNAIKYNTSENPFVKVSCRHNAGFYEISVADNGPGIEAAHHGKIYDIFLP